MTTLNDEFLTALKSQEVNTTINNKTRKNKDRLYVFEVEILRDFILEKRKEGVSKEDLLRIVVRQIISSDFNLTQHLKGRNDRLIQYLVNLILNDVKSVNESQSISKMGYLVRITDSTMVDLFTDLLNLSYEDAVLMDKLYKEEFFNFLRSQTTSSIFVSVYLSKFELNEEEVVDYIKHESNEDTVLFRPIIGITTINARIILNMIANGIIQLPSDIEDNVARFIESNPKLITMLVSKVFSLKAAQKDYIHLNNQGILLFGTDRDDVLKSTWTIRNAFEKVFFRLPVLEGTVELCDKETTESVTYKHSFASPVFTLLRNTFNNDNDDVKLEEYNRYVSFYLNCFKSNEIFNIAFTEANYKHHVASYVTDCVLGNKPHSNEAVYSINTESHHSLVNVSGCPTFDTTLSLVDRDALSSMVIGTSIESNITKVLNVGLLHRIFNDSISSNNIGIFIRLIINSLSIIHSTIEEQLSSIGLSLITVTNDTIAEVLNKNQRHRNALNGILLQIQSIIDVYGLFENILSSQLENTIQPAFTERLHNFKLSRSDLTLLTSECNNIDTYLYGQEVLASNKERVINRLQDACKALLMLISDNEDEYLSATIHLENFERIIFIK